MALHPRFPNSPHVILEPSFRWFPADEALRESTMDKLMPPLVPRLRRKVKEFRDGGYVGATGTSVSLLNWWFNTPHLLPQADGTMAEFQYFFAQREALETIVDLIDVVGVKDKFDLMRFDASGAASAGMFDETWRRFVLKLATGTGKTKVLSLALAWSFYHKLYEPESTLARNFLLIAPNIIVLDIEFPVLTPRIYREYKNLADLDIHATGHQRVMYQQFSEEQQREIVFKDITTGEITHTTILDTAGVADYGSAIGYFTQTVMKELRLVSGNDALYGKIKAFVQNDLFDHAVDLEQPNTLRNLSELAATKAVIEAFKKAINALTVQDKGDAEIRDKIKLRQTRPFVAKDQAYLTPKKSNFNRIIGDHGFELRFARSLEDCTDIVSYAKNYFAVHFKLDYVNAAGNISNYYPDFMVKAAKLQIVIVETKGRADLDVPLEMQRLRQWCDDVNRVQSKVRYDFVYVDEESFERYQPKSFKQLMEGFKLYKNS